MKWFTSPLCLSFLIISPALAFADVTVRSQIIEIFTGWNADQFGIKIADPINNDGNPANCHPNGHPPTGYMSESSRPGYQIFYAAALLAFAERANVAIRVDDEGCVGGTARDPKDGFPRLIGIDIFRK